MDNQSTSSRTPERLLISVRLASCGILVKIVNNKTK